MKVKLALLVLVAVTLVINNPVVADFFFNHPLPKLESIQHESRMKCVPGRTIIKITEPPPQILNAGETDSDEFRLKRRKHMTIPTQDESCKMCVCSADGKDEYCSKRPAETVNECLLLKDIKDKFNAGLPYEHSKSLSFRIRRDYLWHNDEIPYNARAKCFRGHSYYSNSLSANNTDVDVATDIESLLDYQNDNVCFYCVCSVDGSSVGCIHRDVAFCNFFRNIRDDKRVRDHYTSLLEQDRPSYFRQLSWRMRRTMDNSIFELLDTVGNAGLSSTKEKKKCVPFVSEYSNCNDDNLCSGCTRCHCTGEAEWSCRDVKECDSLPGEEEDAMDVADDIFDNALKMLEFQMENKSARVVKNKKNPNVPSPPTSQEQNPLLASVKNYRMDELITALMRPKRSIDKRTNKHSKRSAEKTNHRNNKAENTGNTNNTVKFYDTVDELNEDILKDTNITGTLTAKKIDILPSTGFRRSGVADNSSKSLQIEYNQPKAFNQINDNKIEVTEQEIKFDASHENLKSTLGNYTQKLKDKDLSKIVVNELKKGSEVIGDANAPVTSNITFTPENDTLTAMAFIAGNLLNKLWNMEKDASQTSMETDIIKKEKINDLLELFKEPLNLRQETFLKNALEQLSSSLDKGKEGRNISVCENIEEAKKLLYDTNNTSEEEISNKKTKAPCNKNKEKVEDNLQNTAAIKAIAKINNVLDLIRKFENIQVSLSDLKHGPKLDLNLNRTKSSNKKDEIENKLTKQEKYSLNLFGSLLEKITKLILPKKSSKKIVNQIKSQSIYAGNENLKRKFKKMYNIDLTNMTVTAKDKLILDYLTHVDRNPDCLLSNNDHKAAVQFPSVEGNILLNLSEFFKMKSFSDLIKLLEPEQDQNRNGLRSPMSTTKQLVETTTIYVDKKITSSSKGEDSSKFNSTKEKLKAHLKTIIEDLIELQSAKGMNVDGNIKIADALPCIYNLLNAGKEEIDSKKDEITHEDIDPITKIANIFNGLKKEIKTSQSRRSKADIMEERPKSAVVWERLIKSLNAQSNINSRRSLDSKTPKSYEKIKQMIEKIENGSSTYKHYALLAQVPPAGRLMLLKALEQDVHSTINIIEDIKLAFDNLTKLPAEKFTELAEFVENMALAINLSVKVDEKIKPEIRKYFVNEINSSNKMSKPRIKKKPLLRFTEPLNLETDEMRVSRIQILSQLMRNRMLLFLKTKEQTELDVHNDVNYNIAQRVLYYLDTGNYNLAKELYKVFIMQKQSKSDNLTENNPANDKFTVTSTPKLNEAPMRRMALLQKEPLVEFEDPSRLTAKHANWVNQDHLIKQLINIKNMGM